MNFTEEQFENARLCLREKLLVQAENGDFEVAHAEADDALIEFLRAIGLNEEADIYDNVGKWYA